MRDQKNQKLIDSMRAMARHSATKLVIATLTVVAIAVATNQLVSAECFISSGEGYECYWNGPNPCTYSSCRPVEATCEGSAQTTIWTLVINPPSAWPRCTSYFYAGPDSSCTELMLSCGTTQHFLDQNCSMYCTPDIPGEWVGCKTVVSGSTECP